MLKALDRVEKMDISMICTGHGPVLVGERIKEVMRQYREWSTLVNPNPKKTVVMPYVSAYGYTKMLAEKIAEGVKDSGDVDVRLYDMVEAEPEKVNEELLFADGILTRNTDDRRGSVETDLGSDTRNVSGNSWWKICGGIWQLWMERRGRFAHYGAFKAASHESVGWIPRPV